MERDITKTGTKWLNHRYGRSNGKDREAEDELRRRGFNSKELSKILWDHGQREWRKQAKKARKIRAVRKAKKRSKKRKQWWNQIRKRRHLRRTTPSEGTTTPEARVTLSESDRACLLEKDRNADESR